MQADEERQVGGLVGVLTCDQVVPSQSLGHENRVPEAERHDVLLAGRTSENVV